MISLDPQLCQDLEMAVSREWLETNGIGGFASSTIAGANTRRYHGLLVAATHPPVGRAVLLSKFEEAAVINEKRYELGCNEYPGVIHPRGNQVLVSFRSAPFPTFRYDLNGVILEKSIYLAYGDNTVVIEYQLQSAAPTSPCTLELRPLIAFRDYHTLTRQNGALDPTVLVGDGAASVRPYPDLPTLHFAHNAGAIETHGEWYHNFEYRLERERGLDFQEDLFQPFTLTFDLSKQSTAIVIASTEPQRIEEALAIRNREQARRAAIEPSPPAVDSFVSQLFLAADQFIVQRAQFKTVIAGYHWFTDWGRDTMIAFHGLTLTTKRFDLAKEILLAFAGSIDQGLLPNRFSDNGQGAEYNTVDATLWFFEAIRAFVEVSGDEGFVRQHLYSVLQDILEWHKRGTRFGIHVEEDGLLAAGVEGSQLTWMDAKIGDHVVTPRKGKPVEIQALWYNALRTMEAFARDFGDLEQSAQYAQMARTARLSFSNLFWNEKQQCLYDVVDGTSFDSAVRPNQIFAVCLPFAILEAGKDRLVVDIVERELRTPRGLRTLAPADPMYCSHYEGGPAARDCAYHQGTVWPWLFGPFSRAYLKVHDHSPASVQQVKQWLSGFEEHLLEAGLGQVSEIFDAEAPYTPRGCIAQAWSVAELLRVAVDLGGLSAGLS